MTFTISPWVAWGVAALALFGVVTILYLVSGVLERAGDWWQDRREPLTDEDAHDPILCIGSDQFDAIAAVGRKCPGCDAEEEAALFRDGVGDGDTEGLPPLPPVRSAEELGFTGPQTITEPGAADHFLRPPGYLSAHRERWAPAWEAEARGAYQALDLDYPSGLLARVREAGQ